MLYPSLKEQALTAVILTLTLPSSAAVQPPLAQLDRRPITDTLSHERRSNVTASCRALPGDSHWPNQASWNKLNSTVRGRLLRGTPLASKVCYGNTYDASACGVLESQWPTVDPYLGDPVTVMSPYWLNNTCSPFAGLSAECDLGNLASYAINVSSVGDIIAGVNFVRDNNIRLTIKNTGHDYLGRSTGAGALALWTHHLKDMSFFTYKSQSYTGAAARLGAGSQVQEVYEAASAHGLRVAGGGCPTVGIAGWLQGGGHGPLSSQLGLGADNVLEFEVVTADGKHVVASATENSDLFWALSGGGSGNYAILVSITVRAYRDGPVAGSAFTFLNSNSDAYWGAIKAWLNNLEVLDADYPTLKTAITFTSSYFTLNFATFADKTADQLNDALGPFYKDLASLGIDLIDNQTFVAPDYASHYKYFAGHQPEAVNQTVGSRLIPRSTVRDNMSQFVATIRNITEQWPDAVFVFVGTNVTHANVGNQPGSNAVLPAWRDALLLLNFGRFLSPDAGWEEISAVQAEVNSWQGIFRQLTPSSGSYLNEATWDDPDWKVDYFGSNYDRLARIKAKYDPGYVLWAEAAVGSDTVWKVDATGRMCRRSK
ncbi:FAD-binding domain-containing protein [Xylaria telfairii]|nr:FAD-binding domain-containing protein [Xylaria telfairii]